MKNTQITQFEKDVYSTLKTVDVELFTDKEYDDDDCIYEIPTFITFNDYWYQVWVIKTVKDGNILAYGLYEDSGEKKEYTIDELSLGEAVNLLGYLDS